MPDGGTVVRVIEEERHILGVAAEARLECAPIEHLDVLDALGLRELLERGDGRRPHDDLNGHDLVRRFVCIPTRSVQV